MIIKSPKSSLLLWLLWLWLALAALFHVQGCDSAYPWPGEKWNPADGSAGVDSGPADIGSPQDDPSKPDARPGADKTPNESTPDLRPPDSDVPIDPTARGVCKAVSEAMCASVLSCCSPKWGAQLPFADSQGCVAFLTDDCLQKTFYQEAQAFQKGHITVDIRRARACMDLLASRSHSCSIMNQIEFVQSCKGAFLDKAAIGAKCRSSIGSIPCGNGQGVCYPDVKAQANICVTLGKLDSDCADIPCHSGLVCILKDAKQSCQNPRNVEQSCSQSSECVRGFACIGGLCKQPLGEGEACSSEQPCQLGLVCHPSLQKCVKQAKVGEDCVFSSHCADGSFCDGLLPGASLCKPRSKLNQQCSGSEQCDDGLYCDNGECLSLPGEGKACQPDTGCVSPYLCDGKSCVKAPKSGEPCLSGLKRCGSGLACVEESGKSVCKAKGAKDAACTRDEHCQEGLLCAAQKCTALPHSGPCLKGRCAGGYYCQVGAGVCQKGAREGEPCQVGNECLPSLACVRDATGKKMCIKPPELDKACRLKCKAPLVCRPSLKPGKCIPSICSGSLRP